jgi:hypothetical protein
MKGGRTRLLYIANGMRDAGNRISPLAQMKNY